MTPNGVIFVVFSSQLSALWCSVLLCWSSLTVHCTLISVSPFQVLLRSPTLFRNPALFTSPALLRGPVLFRALRCLEALHCLEAHLVHKQETLRTVL